jgi:hypothetical protein
MIENHWTAQKIQRGTLTAAAFPSPFHSPGETPFADFTKLRSCIEHVYQKEVDLVNEGSYQNSKQ